MEQVLLNSPPAGLNILLCSLQNIQPNRAQYISTSIAATSTQDVLCLLTSLATFACCQLSFSSWLPNHSCSLSSPFCSLSQATSAHCQATPALCQATFACFQASPACCQHSGCSSETGFHIVMDRNSVYGADTISIDLSLSALIF
jgi:hypothetical protein